MARQLLHSPPTAVGWPLAPYDRVATEGPAARSMPPPKGQKGQVGPASTEGQKARSVPTGTEPCRRNDPEDPSGRHTELPYAPAQTRVPWRERVGGGQMPPNTPQSGHSPPLGLGKTLPKPRLRPPLCIHWTGGDCKHRIPAPWSIAI